MTEFCGRGIVASALDSEGTLVLAEHYAEGGFFLIYTVDYLPDGAETFTDRARMFESKRAARRYYAERVTELYA